MPDTSDVEEHRTEDRPHAAGSTPHATGVRDRARLATWGWPVVVALSIAVIAAALAAAAWFYPRHPAPSFTDQQRADATKHLCAAYAVAHDGVVANTHLPNPVPGNPAGQLAVAANARLALLGGGAFLHDRLAAEPATPPELKDAVTALAGSIEELGMGYLAGRDATLAPLRHQLDTEITQLNELCS